MNKQHVTQSIAVSGPTGGIAGYAVVAFLAVLLLVFGLGGWAASFELASAVLAQGMVVVESNVKKVQHPTGGIVGEIRIKEGEHVKAGAVLMRLDSTVAQANLSIVTKLLDELAVRKARLAAEQSGRGDMFLPDDIQARIGEHEIAEIVTAERALLASRRATRVSKSEQLRQRIAQLGDEIAGLEIQLQGKTQEAELVDQDLAGLERLEGQGLITTTRITSVRRDLSRLLTERGRLMADVAQTKGRVIETELQLTQIDSDTLSTVVQELREVQSKEAELSERRLAAEDQLRRIDIVAPQAGIIHQLGVHTIGGIVGAGETIMQIVPQSDRLVVEARIAQQDIEQVRTGQKAYLRLTAFDRQVTPELLGNVERLAPDVVIDQALNAAYFVARIALPASEIDKLDGGPLLPGMPVDVQIRTGGRTALSYLTKPLRDQFSKAFRER